MINNMKKVFPWIVSMWLLIMVSLAQAAWWEFGRQDNEPAITDLKLNSVDVVWAEDKVTLSPEDLVQGEIIIRGQADIRKGIIGLVEISLDDGKSWSKAELGERGLFSYEFRPEIGRSYGFRIRAFSTTGVSTDEEDHSFTLSVTTLSNVDEVRRTFMALLHSYMDENRIEFMRYVSEDFEGDRMVLEDAISDDFRWLDQIRIQPYISRIVNFDQEYQVYFTFNRQVVSVADGRVLRDSAATTATFRREEGGFLLSRLAAPLIFGISNPAEIATSVTTESVGQNVITLDGDTGSASTQQQGQSVEESTVEEGSITLTANNYGEAYQSFSFADGGERFDENTPGSFEGDIAFPGFAVMLANGVGFQQIAGPLSAIDSVPENGYNTTAGEIFNVSAGDTYALQLFGSTPTYAAIEVLSITMEGATASASFVFRYKYQPNGSANLQ